MQKINNIQYLPSPCHFVFFHIPLSQLQVLASNHKYLIKYTHNSHY